MWEWVRGLFKMEIPAPVPRASFRGLRWASHGLLWQVPPHVWDPLSVLTEKGAGGKGWNWYQKQHQRLRHGTKKATVVPVLAGDLCICTCIPMIIVKTLSGREYIFLLIRLSVTLNLKGKPHILEEVPTVHRCPHLSLLLKKLSSD